MVNKTLFTHMNIMGRGMKSADKVSIVTAPRTPVDDKLLLLDAIADPVEAHVYDLGGFLLDAIVGKADSGVIIPIESQCPDHTV